MKRDLQIIKKKYGENMSKLCQELFPQLLDTDGLLSNLMLTHFEPSRELYNDIVSNHLTVGFSDYIYSLIATTTVDYPDKGKSPKELLDKAGYNLYECTTEEEIQSFKKYYTSGEELCTFNGGRLNKCKVFFAVKKDVDKIRREDFPNPEREDQYGTSVISIQFTNDMTHRLSIKNRYNHHVENPDNTFNNNLDNIIVGLTSAFEKEYGLTQHHRKSKFEIPNYKKANDGKFYKYNYEILDTYYCPNNIIIENSEVKKLEKEKYILLDYFILDLQNKKIMLYNQNIKDSFVMSIGEIEKIEVANIVEGKEIYITPKEGEVIKITLDQENRIIGLKNNNVKKIEYGFLIYNVVLEELQLDKAEIIGDYFLYRNMCLQNLNLPTVKTIGNRFLYADKKLIKFHAPNLESIGDYFMFCNNVLEGLELLSLESTGKAFLYCNSTLTTLNIPNLKTHDHLFLTSNSNFKDKGIKK